MRFLPAICLAALLIQTGCQPESDSEISVDEGEPLVFDTVARGQSASTRDTLEVIIRSADDWSRVSDQFQPVNPFPDLDFSQTMVGIVSIPANSGGYSIDVESVELVDSTLVVAYILNVPGSSCITPQALAEAYQVFTIRQADFSATEFTRRTDTYSCEVDQ